MSFAYGSFLGYKKGPDGKPEVIPEEAAVIEEIYDRFLSGESFQQIAIALQSQGIKTPKGCGEWSYTTIRSILRSEKYKGDALLQKTYIEDCISKRVRKNNGECPPKGIFFKAPTTPDTPLFRWLMGQQYCSSIVL
ncbi:MAG: recombinase family protein [Firmicutes bacterium]|nr:recombinase family protein [Bacillota bacterium]